MASNDLTIQVERSQLLLIQDAVKKLFKVNVIESNTITSNKNGTNNAINESQSCRAVNASDCKQNSGDRQQLAASSTKPETSSVTLRFEGDVSVEDLEKAKNFARVHLQPGPDYTTSPHQLENQQEFNMVLESSQDIQTATTALLTFDPACLEVTLQGLSNTVATARSKVVMILDELREQTRTDSNISANIDFLGNCPKLFDNLLLDNFVEKQNNNDSCKLSHTFFNGPDSTEITNSKQCHSRVNSSHPIDINESQNRGPNKNQPNWHLTQPELDSFDDIECDATQNLVTSTRIKSVVPPVYSKCGELLGWTLVSSSTDDDNSCEENILTDPRYSKKIEQTLKLGYSEKQVTKALSKLGPDCTLNDLLSELIKLGTSDADPSISKSLSPESDTVFSDYALDFGHRRRQRLNVIRSESGDSSSFSSSADSHGSSLVDLGDSSNLRDVIIDGSNVAMSHGKKVFSCKGIRIAVDWFRDRGHRNITAFIPQWRKETSRPDAPITDQEILSDLEKEGIVVFTPARRVKGRRVVCYDDRYILKLAVETDGIVVSNDVYRDLVNEREDFRKVVDQRLLMYSFVNDRFMPPEDPLGRLGPTLDNFLRKVPSEPTPKPQDCPYGKKCTYGNKCRFYHPERGFAPQKLITETLKEQSDLKLQERATRLSEIAEKGKRSKQKLSRTKSLVPWEIQAVSQLAGGGAKNKQEKPKLSHSKSLVLSNKSSDYLNESRKKLEEAELAELERMSAHNASFSQQLLAHPFSPGDFDLISKTKSPSPRSSPAPQKDVTKQAATSGDSVSKNCFPLKSVSTNSPRASPSHLTVPKPEPPERYLSGHLYLAKKLSDESIESSFFSEHTSSPSSTRTSSPVLPVSKIPEQKQFTMTNTHSKNTQEDISGSFTFPPPFHPALFYQQQPAYSPQTGGHHDLENIPHLSIFEQGMSQSTDSSPSYRRDSVDNALFVNYTYQNLNPHSPDSGLYTSTESILSPYQNQPEYQQSRPYPLFKAEQPLHAAEHQSLRRAFSSTGNFKTAEDLHHKLGRRASGFSPSHFGDEHLSIKPHLEKPTAYQIGHPYSWNRQNSSSDPQMHAVVAGELQDVLSPSFSPGDSARNLYPSASQHCQTQQYQQRHFENQQQLQRLQQQKQDFHFMSYQVPKPNVNIWGEPVSQSNLGHRSSLGGATQCHYNAVPSSASVHNHMPHFPAATGSTNIMTASTYNPQPSHSHPHHQPAMTYATQFDPASVSMFTSPRRQSFPSPSTYSHPHNVIPSNPVFGSSDHQHAILAAQQASMPTILPDNAPMLPDDPRYTIYYHLSNVFSEQVVRTVMNRQPNERNPDHLCKLIMQYKHETGL